MDNKKRLAVITCCLEDWGGSEELWARSISVLIGENFRNITVYKNRINLNHPEYAKLLKDGVRFEEIDPKLSLFRKFTEPFKNALNHAAEKIGFYQYKWNKPAETLYQKLKVERPDVVLISQGINFDGLVYAYQCFKLNIPYLIVSHKAVDFFWPAIGDRAYMQETLLNAKRSFYVSEHNRRLTEEQFGVRLPNSEIVFNPVKTAVSVLPFPSTSQGYKLACVGRLFVIDKGQDILLRVLAQPKWKERNITVSFLGKGPDKEGIQALAALLGVVNITFSGFNAELNNVWADHHALILPSRSEGLPLTIIEAMSLGRMVIATNAGGNKEVVENEVNGFVAEPNEVDLDRAMESAWSRRTEWESMGIVAAKSIAARIPPSPEIIFADQLKTYL